MRTVMAVYVLVVGLSSCFLPLSEVAKPASVSWTRCLLRHQVSVPWNGSSVRGIAVTLSNGRGLYISRMRDPLSRETAYG